MSRLFSGIFAYGQTSPRQQQGQQQQGKIVAQKEPAIQLHREDMPPKAVKGEYIETVDAQSLLVDPSSLHA